MSKEDKSAKKQTPPEQFSAYVNIPSPVFFDGNLSDKAKLLYGLLSCMSNHRGYCWAKNDTLCRFIGTKSDGTLRRHLRELKSAKYIEVEQIIEDGTVWRKIKVSAIANLVQNHPVKNDRPPGQNQPPPPVKNDRQNNSNINNTPIVPNGDKSNGQPIDPLFEAFWNAYGYKVKRKNAERAWKKLHVADTPGLFEDIMAGLALAKASRQWQDGYVPHPSTWLNGERWKDELPEMPQPQKQAPPATGGKSEPNVEVWA